jgi:1,4-dihydroxy-2-naphthoate octaprenyltransferase
VFFGFVAVCGTVYVQLGWVPPLAWWAAVPVGALATAILVVNNVRDRATDTRAGKRTLAVRFGRPVALVEYALMLMLAYAIPLAIALHGRPWAALPLVTLPVAVLRMRALLHAVDGPEHNACLAATAQLLMAHGILFATGLALG